MTKASGFIRRLFVMFQAEAHSKPPICAIIIPLKGGIIIDGSGEQEEKSKEDFTPQIWA